MREELTAQLRCPRDGAPLRHEADALVCESDHRWPIVRGIPRLFDRAELSGEQRSTADAFGYSWTHYPKTNPYTDEQWADWIVPLTREDFAGKRVLDGGCGLAGFAEYARRWGASQVVGIDLSEAIDAAMERVGDRIDLVQGDLNNPPFEPGTFDLAYSIGVLHHLPDPERGFQALARTVKPGGLVFGWVYGREGNGWIVRFVDPVRKHALTRIPRSVVKWGVSLPLAVVVRAGSLLAEHARSLPYGDYLRWLAQRDFEFTHGVVFDHLVAPTAYYIRREEFEAWFQRAGLVDVQITQRNGNSWRGLGRRPE